MFRDGIYPIIFLFKIQYYSLRWIYKQESINFQYKINKITSVLE